MEVVLLLVLLVGAHGIETSCDARQSGAQCYGALNGTVYLHLTDIISRYDYKLVGNTKQQVFRKRRNQVYYFNKQGNVVTDGQVEFYNNGTLRINKIGKEYSDKYTLEIIQESGATSNHILQLSIEAPVSSPSLVISQCLPQGQMRMSCSCEGDSPRYSWTLDGRALNDSRVVHDKESSSLTLERGTVGKLTCTVKNHISEATVDFTVVSTCNDITVIVARSLAGVLLIAVLLGIFCELYKRKTAASAVSTEEEGEVPISMSQL